jgi:hypothetical protein
LLFFTSLISEGTKKDQPKEDDAFSTFNFLALPGRALCIKERLTD